MRRYPLVTNLILALTGFATACINMLVIGVVFSLLMGGTSDLKALANSDYASIVDQLPIVLPLPAVIFVIVALVVGGLYQVAGLRRNRGLLQANTLFLLIFTVLLALLAIPIVLVSGVESWDAFFLVTVQFTASLSAFLLWNHLLYGGRRAIPDKTNAVARRSPEKTP